MCEIRHKLTSAPVLSIYDSNKEHVVQTDASNEYIGGTLLQLEDDGYCILSCMLVANVLREKCDMIFKTKKCLLLCGCVADALSICMAGFSRFKLSVRR